MKYFLARLREPSTWAGLASIAVMFGIPTSSVNAVVQVAGSIAAAVAVFAPDHPAQ